MNNPLKMRGIEFTEFVSPDTDYRRISSLNLVFQNLKSMVKKTFYTLIKIIFISY
tara:strand:+ start:3241 stop:3405 length:165 start_codon:yes stop_codon:yes gene_type:complete